MKVSNQIIFLSLVFESSQQTFQGDINTFKSSIYLFYLFEVFPLEKYVLIFCQAISQLNLLSSIKYPCSKEMRYCQLTVEHLRVFMSSSLHQIFNIFREKQVPLPYATCTKEHLWSRTSLKEFGYGSHLFGLLPNRNQVSQNIRLNLIRYFNIKNTATLVHSRLFP